MAISGRTALLSILGDPLDNARSPAMVNRALEARRLDAVLMPLRVSPGSLSTVVKGLRQVRNWHGAIITMPHKEAIVGLIDDPSPESKLLGACNVLRRDADGRIRGTILDGEGFVGGLRATGHDISGKRIYMAGAGGTAAAIAYAFCKYGASRLTIVNRTAARAENLATRISGAWPDTAVRANETLARDTDIVVNATSLGMRAEDPSPVDAKSLQPHMLAADVVIRDAATPFLATADARGCTTHPGLRMLENQLELLIDFMLPASPAPSICA